MTSVDSDLIVLFKKYEASDKKNQARIYFQNQVPLKKYKIIIIVKAFLFENHSYSYKKLFSYLIRIQSKNNNFISHILSISCCYS